MDRWRDGEMKEWRENTTVVCPCKEETAERPTCGLVVTHIK